MKNIFLIGGTMGVGKTTISKELNHTLKNSVFLDGDWCWDASPFIVNDETKKMVMENICFLLNQFIKCKEYENIIFCWVMNENNIINEIISNLNKEYLKDCNVYKISLICSKHTLETRINKDILNGLREKESLQRSIDRIDLYNDLDTIKINTDNLEVKDIVNMIVNLTNK